jgi:hypothetical protein
VNIAIIEGISRMAVANMPRNKPLTPSDFAIDFRQSNEFLWLRFFLCAYMRHLTTSVTVRIGTFTKLAKNPAMKVCRKVRSSSDLTPI